MTVKDLKQFLENIPDDAEVWTWVVEWYDFDTLPEIDANIWYSPQDNAIKFVA